MSDRPSRAVVRFAEGVEESDSSDSGESEGTLRARASEIMSLSSDASPPSNRAIMERMKQELSEMPLDTGESSGSDDEVDERIYELQALSSEPQVCVSPLYAPLHVVFVIDSSGSMKNHDVVTGQFVAGASGMWMDETWVPSFGDFAPVEISKKSRLGIVLTECKEFMQSSTQLGASSLSKDATYSLITFNSTGTTRFKRQAAKSARLQIPFKLKPRGESRFRAALAELHELLSIECGSCVVIHGLLNASALNGTSGVCEQWHGDTGRWGVRLSDGSLKGIKPDNIRLNEDVRVLLLSDGRPHEIAHFEELKEEAVREGVRIYTVGFGSSVEDFRTYLKPLSTLTGGTFNITRLSQGELTKVFTSVATTITTGRASEPAISGVDAMTTPFDSTIEGTCCTIECSVSKVRKVGGRKKLQTWSVVNLAPRPGMEVKQKPFAHGGMRLVYKMADTWNPKESALVAKTLIGTQHATVDDMLPFCKNAYTAIGAVPSFLKEIKDIGINMTVFFVPCDLYEYKHDDGDSCMVVEQFLEGNFVKFNSNNGYVNNDKALSAYSELMQAFSHFTFVVRKGREMVVDLQGVADGEHLVLTDPQVLSRDRGECSPYGHGDLGWDGIQKFFGTHVCGPTCKALKLQQRQQHLVKDLELLSRRCLICCDAPRNVVLKPCGHSLMCRTCALNCIEKEQPCPSCRSPFEEFDEGLASKTYIPPAERHRIRQRNRRHRRQGK